MKIRKLILPVLCSLMIGAMSLTGCSKPAQPETPAKEEETVEAAEPQEAEEAAAEEAAEPQEAEEAAKEETAGETAGQQEETSKEPAGEEEETDIEIDIVESTDQIDYDGIYTSKEDVSLYLYTYGELPSNFITKKEAKALGWSGGSLEPYAPGCCIGGDRFGNYEGILPDGEYHECDIDTLYQKSRGAKRLVYSDDGRIYYTKDHYEHFELLYGEE